MKYAISVVVHNNLELTRRCLESIFECSAGEDYLLIVHDNASSDGTFEYLRDVAYDRPNVDIYTAERNLGFGIPHNAALKYAMNQSCPPDYFVVLNNDLEVCGSWLRDMTAALKKDPLNAICGIKGTCCGIGRDGVGHPSGSPEYVEASCLMIRADLAQKHGLFSPEFEFAYYEDSDLSLRMRQLGYKITFVTLPIRHQGAATSKIVADVDLRGFYLRNQKIFLEKWKDYLARRSFGARTIMVVRGAALGDVILTTPVIRALRDKYPNAEISVVTQFPEVYARNPNVQYAGKKMLRQRDKYDLFFDLNMAYERNPKAHIVEAYSKVCGVTSGTTPEVFPADADFEWSQNLFASDQWVAIHPGPTAWPGRNWPKERFSEVSEFLMGNGLSVVLVGGPDAHAIPCTMDLRGKTSFHQLAALMDEMTLFVGIDSAPMHLAVAAQIPAVAVFGCIDPKYRSSEWLCAVTAPFPEVGCLGCHHYLPAPRVASECFRDSSKVPLCMDRITAESVIAVIDRELARGLHE